MDERREPKPDTSVREPNSQKRVDATRSAYSPPAVVEDVPLADISLTCPIPGVNAS